MTIPYSSAFLTSVAFSGFTYATDWIQGYDPSKEAAAALLASTFMASFLVECGIRNCNPYVFAVTTALAAAPLEYMFMASEHPACQGQRYLRVPNFTPVVIQCAAALSAGSVAGMVADRCIG